MKSIFTTSTSFSSMYISSTVTTQSLMLIANGRSILSHALNVNFLIILCIFSISLDSKSFISYDFYLFPCKVWILNVRRMQNGELLARRGLKSSFSLAPSSGVFIFRGRPTFFRCKNRVPNLILCFEFFIRIATNVKNKQRCRSIGIQTFLWHATNCFTAEKPCCTFSVILHVFALSFLISIFKIENHSLTRT